MRREGFVSVHALIGEPGESRSATTHHAPIISQYATIEAYATVDAGTIKATRIDPDAWLFKHSHVGHDAHVMEGAEVSTGAVLGGHVIVGPGSRIGLNATILPWRVIGARARIGAGAVVTKDVPPGETWAGNPARKMEPKTDWDAHAAENARIRASGYCGDCGQLLTAPGAPGICAAGHMQEDERSSSAPEPTTPCTESRHATSTSPATSTASSTPTSALSATDADAAWSAWLDKRATSAKRTTLPARPPGGFIEASAPHARKNAPSQHRADL